MKLFSTEDIDSLLEGIPLDYLYDSDLAIETERLIWGPDMRDIPLGAPCTMCQQGRCIK